MQHLRFIFRLNVHSNSLTKPTINPSFFVGLVQSPQNHSQLRFSRSFSSETQKGDGKNLVRQIENVLKKYGDSPTRKIELALDHCDFPLTEGLVLDVIKKYRSDWKMAYIFFNWVSKSGEIPIGSCVYNEILDVLGRMRRFEEVDQVLDEMSKRGGVLNGETYRVLVSRYVGAHKVDEAIGVFKKRKEFGLEVDSDAFQKLLMYLCRHKHVEIAETLLHEKDSEFGVDIKTLNIVLNGWCVLNNVYEAKRFWKDIVLSKCKPDLFTYATFIKALTKKGKLGTAMKLYRAMWKQGCIPDAVICNCMIDALCLKKRIPEALEIFNEMNEHGCSHTSATYNSLIKHLCKIRRMEKVYELLDEMEKKGGSIVPNEVTYNCLLKSLKKPEEIPGILEKMERNGCKLSGDQYNLILKLYACWNSEEMLRSTWDEMEANGFGPDRRSYTIMIHWLYDKGRNEEALSFFREMQSKGMMPEPRTQILVTSMKEKMKENRIRTDGKEKLKRRKKSSRNKKGRKWLKASWKMKFR